MSIKPVYFYIRNRDIYVMYPMIKVIEMYIAFEPFCEYSSKTTLEYQICPVRNIVKLSPFKINFFILQATPVCLLAIYKKRLSL